MSSRIEAAGEPQTVDEARDAVEKSRQRISSTLDRLEDRIVDKKHELQDRMDVLRPVRDQVNQRPFTAVAVGIGVGALLGSLGGRGDDDDRDSGGDRPSRSRLDRDGILDADERAELREWRRHRRRHLSARSSSQGNDRDDDGSGRLDALKHQVVGALTSAIGAVVTAKVKEFTGMSDGNRQSTRGTSREISRGYERDSAPGDRERERSMR